MKRPTSLTILSLVAAFAACSSNKGSTGAPPSNATSTDGGGGGGNDGASPGDDSGTGDDGSATGDDGGTSATEYGATMNPAQVVPHTTATSSGTAKFLLQPDGQTLTYDITQNVANPQAVNIHVGAPGENGSVAHQLTPVSGHMTGTITLTMDEQSALAADQLYVDVTSAAFQGGEIRGQITLPGATIYTATLAGSQEVPPVMSAYDGHASFIVSADGATVLYHVVTTATPTNIVFAKAIGGLNGQIVSPLANIGQTVDGSYQTAASDPADIQAGHFYLNVMTSQNPAGELRGQIIPVGSTLYTGVLSGMNEVPPNPSMATGAAQFVLSPDAKTLAYEAQVSGTIPTSADMGNAPRGMAGPTLYQLTLANGGALGQQGLVASDVNALRASTVFVNIHSAGYANGELRAQMIAP